jgi:hypothetical protein
LEKSIVARIATKMIERFQAILRNEESIPAGRLVFEMSRTQELSA